MSVWRQMPATFTSARAYTVPVVGTFGTVTESLAISPLSNRFPLPGEVPTRSRRLCVFAGGVQRNGCRASTPMAPSAG